MTVPLREEVIEELAHQGETVALLTRNSYGSLILNTASVLFADIDYRDGNGREAYVTGTESPGLFSQLLRFVARILGKEVSADRDDAVADPPSEPPSEDDRIVERVRSVTARHDGLGVRLYRTANGFRCLVTSGTWDPMAAETTRLLEELGSDPLYVTLCRGQECFRARLSPKPWRCEMPTPAIRFPWPDDAAEQEYRQWVAAYERGGGRVFGHARLSARLANRVWDPAVEADSPPARRAVLHR